MLAELVPVLLTTLVTTGKLMTEVPPLDPLPATTAAAARPESGHQTCEWHCWVGAVLGRREGDRRQETWSVTGMRTVHHGLHPVQCT